MQSRFKNRSKREAELEIKQFVAREFSIFCLKCLPAIDIKWIDLYAKYWNFPLLKFENKEMLVRHVASMIERKKITSMKSYEVWKLSAKRWGQKRWNFSSKILSRDCEKQKKSIIVRRHWETSWIPVHDNSQLKLLLEACFMTQIATITPSPRLFPKQKIIKFIPQNKLFWSLNLLGIRIYQLEVMTQFDSVTHAKITKRTFYCTIDIRQREILAQTRRHAFSALDGTFLN